MDKETEKQALQRLRDSIYGNYYFGLEEEKILIDQLVAAWEARGRAEQAMVVPVNDDKTYSHNDLKRLIDGIEKSAKNFGLEVHSDIEGGLLLATSGRASGQVVCWRYRNKRTGCVVFTEQPPDRVSHVEEYEVTELFAASPQITTPAARSDEAQEAIDTLLSDAREIVWNLANLHTAIATARAEEAKTGDAEAEFKKWHSELPESTKDLIAFGEVRYAWLACYDWMKRSTNAPVGVPDGWKPVPATPTEIMCSAYFSSIQETGMFTEAYKAMINAVTQPPNSDSPSPSGEKPG